MNHHEKEVAPPIDQSRNDEYVIFRRGDRSDGTHRSLDYLKMDYLTKTDELIRQMTEGWEVTNNGESEHVTPDVVVFLDKSARPVSWLTRKLWPTLAADSQTGEVPPMPEMKFLNIDRNQWLGTLDPNNSDALDFNRMDNALLEGLRSLYNPRHDGSFDAENSMDNKSILVVDEVRSSGRTLQIATGILNRAFPTSSIRGTHWMSETAVVNGVRGNNELPVWYRDDSTDVKLVTGRGVGNRRDVGSITHPSQYFLSTPFPEPDQRSLRLRDDINLLVEELHNGTVAMIPSMYREDDDQERRVKKYNNGADLFSIYALRRAIAKRDNAR